MDKELLADIAVDFSANCLNASTSFAYIAQISISVSMTLVRNSILRDLIMFLCRLPVMIPQHLMIPFRDFKLLLFVVRRSNYYHSLIFGSYGKESFMASHESTDSSINW